MSEDINRFRSVRRAFGKFRRRVRTRREALGGHVARLVGEERVETWKDKLTARRQRLRAFVHQYIDPESWYYPYARGAAKYSLYFLFFLIGYVFVLQTNFLYLTGAMPTVEDLRNPKLSQASEIYSLDGQMIAKFYAENRTPIQYKNIPKHLAQALIATEDARFYDHGGIDPRAIGRAAFSFGRDGGGSTITQQLAKNLFKTRRRTSDGILNRVPFVRKIVYKSKEWLMAITLEGNFTKEEILTYYFNTVDFGQNSFGLKTAARTFFNKMPDSLSVQEGAALVGLQKATTFYNPLKNPKNALTRRNIVLAQMAKYDFLTKTAVDSISALPLETDYMPENPYAGPASYLKSPVEDFMKEWGERNGYDLYTDGLKIYTTIDSRMQKYAEEAVQERMKKLQRTFANHWRDRDPWTDENGEELPGFIDSVARRTERYKTLVKRFQLYPDSVAYYMKVKKQRMKVFDWDAKNNARQVEMSPYDSIVYYKKLLQAGMVAMDPHSGHIRAWVGGLNHDYFKYDHVRQGRRQPGSTFKPFVYATAIDDTAFNMTPCDRIRDKPFRKRYRENGQEKVWEPKNSSGGFTYSNMTLRRALARSVNSITAQLTDMVGPERVVEYAHKLGITSKLDAVASIGLGSSDVSLYELVSSYCTFVNEGQYTTPMIVQRIEDRNGVEIESFKPERRPAISPESAYLMLYMLQGGLQERGGTSQNLWSFDLFKHNHQMGGKTGTTSNNSDGWFVGVSDKLVVGAWVGGDDRSIHFRSTDLGEGAKTAMPLVGGFLEKVYADSRFRSLQGPFPKATVDIQKQYDNCVYEYDDYRGSREESSDSTADDGGGGTDSLFVPPLPVVVPDPPDTTGAGRPKP